MKNIFLFVGLVAYLNVAEALIFKTVDGKTEFFAVGKPAMIKINGEGQSPEGTLTIVNNLVNGKLTVDLTKLTTKIDLRDDHMKNKYLEVSKYPNAVLTLKDLKLPADLSSLKNEIKLPFFGEFTLHGKTKPVTGEVTLSSENKNVFVKAEFEVKVMDYIDTLPEWFGMKVADSVKIKTNFKGISL